MRWHLKGWLWRGLTVAALTVIVALWALVQPLSEPPSPALMPTAMPVLSACPERSRREAEGPTSTPTPSPTSVPTLTSTPTATSSSAPTSTYTPTPTITPPPGGAEAPTATQEAKVTPEPATVESPITPAEVKLAGRVEQHVYFSPTTGDEEPYRIYLPPDYEQTDRRYPVLYLIHGWPYDEFHWDNLGADEAADAGIQASTLPAFIIVMPGADPEGLFVNSSGGDHSFEGQIVNDLIPHIDATYRTRVEREGRAIGGISRGGVWSLEIGFHHPDIFAAVGAHSPALSLNMAPTSYDPFYLMKRPGVTALRIYLDAGDSDWAREGTQALHEALDEQGIASEFIVHPGRHANELWAANMAEYLAFYAAGWFEDGTPP
ncbi:MAG: alpha/beta hydrolase [Anaerolineae bacterium]